MKIIDKIPVITENHKFYDLSTPCDNMLVKLNDKIIVAHNSPACFFGTLNDQFFVASKSLFNKDPKINFSLIDIDRNHPDGPHDALTLAFIWLKGITPKGKIFQGDFLFSNDTKKTQEIDGKTYITFHPNTIMYAVEKDTPLGQQIDKAKIGIVVHTEYQSDGVNVSSIKLKGFGVSETEFKKSSDVFLIDAYHKDFGSIIAFSKQESEMFDMQIKELKKLQNGIQTLPDALSREILAFCNTFIRNGQNVPDASEMTSRLIGYLEEKRDIAVSKLKSAKGQEKKMAEWNSLIEQAKSYNLINMFKARAIITELKLKLIRKMDSVSKLKTFVKDSNGNISVTGQEGFVLCKTSAHGCKLVDRMEFSKNNFDKSIVKGWTSERR